jgi:hypothetical protein
LGLSTEYSTLVNQATKDVVQWQLGQFSATLEQAAALVTSVRDLTDIMRDEDGRAILLFTLITVIFLPLSFVASYLSMSDGPNGEDWRQVQGLFWKAAGPLAVGIGVFCLGVSWNGSTVETAKWWVRSKMRVRRWGGRDDESWTVSDSPSEKGVV